MARDSSSDPSSSSDEEPSKKNETFYASKKSHAITTRPNASPGYWLCCLLPLAFLVSYLRYQSSTNGNNNNSQCIASSFPGYKMLTIASMGMCIESLCFFMYMFVDSGLLLKLLISLVPGLVSTIMFSFCLDKPLIFGVFWGFAITFCYQNAYIRIMRRLPQCFTFGEACVVVQGLALFVLNCILQLPLVLLDEVELDGEFAPINALMMSALFCLLIACWLLSAFKRLHHIYYFYSLLGILLISVTTIPITSPIPIVKVLQFIFSDQRRIFIIIFYLALVVATVCTIGWQLRNSEKASTRVRKIFHVLVVFVFVPGLLYQCTFLYLASGVAFAIFTVVELFRILDIPPLGIVLKSSFASFSDEKDAGAIALTPFCLLIGVALPLWVSPCSCNNHDSAIGDNLLPLMAGILSIGVGDTVASVIGSKYGRLKWKNSTRTLEGTFAYVVAVSLVVYALYFFGFTSMSNTKWIITATAIVVSSLVEAHTNQIDNLVLPLVFYIIVRLV